MHGSDHRDQLEKLTFPVAIVHHGAFVYANAAFLELFGLSRREDLSALPFLDLVEATDHERTRLLLSDGLQHSHSEGEVCEQPLRLRTQGAGVLQAIAQASRIRFEDEESVRITLVRQSDRSMCQRLKQLPWRLYLSVAFVALFALLPALLLTRLHINNAPKVYFADDEPAVLIDEALRERFPNDQVFVLLFEGVALFSEGFLQAMEGLASIIQGMDNVDDVLALTRLDNIRGSADGFLVEPLFDPRRLGEMRWREKLEKAAGDRFAARSLVAVDGSAIALVVIPDTLNNSFKRLALHEAVTKAVGEARLSGYLTALAGQMAVDVAVLRAMLHDNMLFIPVTMTIGLSLIWLLFRRLLAVVVAGVAIGVVTNSTVALFTVLGEPYTLTSSIIPPLLSALTVAALIHLFNAMQYASQRGYVGRARVQRALDEVKRPALFTALTTAAGLASLGTSPVVPTALFGLFSAGGVLLAYVVVMIISPTFFTRWDHSPWPRTRLGLKWMDVLVRRLSGSAMRDPVVVVIGVCAVLAIGSTQLWRIVVETDLQQFFLPDHTIRVATDRIDEKLVGTNSLDIVFEVEERDGLLEPALLRKIKAFQEWVEVLAQVDKATSLLDFIEEMHWGFNEEDPKYRTIPNDRRLISQYLLVYDGDDLWDFVDRDLRLTHMALNLNVHSVNQVTALMGEIRRYAATHFPENGAIKVDIAGFGRLLADMEDLIITGQVSGLLGALALIMLLMLIEWRSLGGALICMVPNLSPILLIFMLMGLFGIWLDIATAMIASVAVGIAVDDTIHIYHGFIRRQRRHGNVAWAMARTFRHAGRAVTTTTLVLCAQFMALMTSAFVPMSNFGLLTSIGLVTAWLFDVVLLPAMLVLIFGQHRSKKAPLAKST